MSARRLSTMIKITLNDERPASGAASDGSTLALDSEALGDARLSAAACLALPRQERASRQNVTPKNTPTRRNLAHAQSALLRLFTCAIVCRTLCSSVASSANTSA